MARLCSDNFSSLAESIILLFNWNKLMTACSQKRAWSLRCLIESVSKRVHDSRWSRSNFLTNLCSQLISSVFTPLARRHLFSHLIISGWDTRQMISRREPVRFNLRRIFFFRLSSPRNNNSNDNVYKRLLLCLYFQSSFERKLIVLMRETSSFQEVVMHGRF